MLFLKEEKVFSLSKVAAAVPSGDTTSLFQEFFSFLLIAGLFREGESTEGARMVIPAMSEEHFYLPDGSYTHGINEQISIGLMRRYRALAGRHDLNKRETKVLDAFNHIFTHDVNRFITLTGKEIFGVAAGRRFESDYLTIARYVSVMYGQSDHPSSQMVPRLYLSVFGDICLTKPYGEDTVHPVSNAEYTDETKILLEPPFLRYGGKAVSGDIVTAMWSLMSGMATALSNHVAPGRFFSDMLRGFSFLGKGNEYEKTVPAPRYATSLYIKSLMGIDDYNPVAPSAAFYQHFLYGNTGNLMVTRHPLLLAILNVMMEKMGETHLEHLFVSNLQHQELATASIQYGYSNETPALLQVALEALEPDLTEANPPKASTPDTVKITAPEAPETDPQTDAGGFDPSAPPPASPSGDLDTAKNTIDLISFDKSGEGVTEDLYRAAVVALNDRLRNDETVPVTAEVKEALNQWVGGWIYRTAISATKDRISSLNLQEFLKNF